MIPLNLVALSWPVPRYIRILTDWLTRNRVDISHYAAALAAFPCQPERRFFSHHTVVAIANLRYKEGGG